MEKRRKGKMREEKGTGSKGKEGRGKRKQKREKGRKEVISGWIRRKITADPQWGWSLSPPNPAGMVGELHSYSRQPESFGAGSMHCCINYIFMAIRQTEKQAFLPKWQTRIITLASP